MTAIALPEAHSTETAQLVSRAANGERAAWDRLVMQYTRLIWAITRDFRLSESDAADAAQTAWLRLTEHIHRIDPARVGAWLAVTTRRECMRVLALRKRVVLAYDDDAMDAVPGNQPDVDERMLAEERAEDVRRALETLPERWQELLRLLMSDPPLSYAEISERLGLPIGSIGPMRRRCLEKLRVLLER